MSATSDSAPPTAHRWKFFRAGGLDQVSLETAEDFRSLCDLDQKLWVALSCPTRGLEFDSRTLDLIDSDKDGRIRVPEILEAVKFAILHLKNPADLLKSMDALPLSSINDSHDAGKRLLSAAREILKNLGKADATVITVEDTTDTTKIFVQTKFNGDGIVPPASAPDDDTRKVIEDIIATLGSEPDRGGGAGVSQTKVDSFFAELQAHADWWDKAQTDRAGILPFGDATPQAHQAFRAVRAKMDDYFGRCRLAAFDPRAAAPMNRAEAEFIPLATKALSSTVAEVADFPLAHIEANRPLSLTENLNPAWMGAMITFHREVIVPPHGAAKKHLTVEEWTALCAKFAPYEAWQADKKGALVERLGLPRVRQILGTTSKQTITRLIEQDKALEPEFAAISAVDKLVRYYRDLYRLLNNFVSFTDFYSQRHAIFQVGTLYLDGRSCDLCIQVEDMARHNALAALSGAYLAYCECVRKATGEKMTVAAAFTSGDSDNLMVGRNGVFYDRRGRDWDATIVKIIDSPISIGQAFWAPYKKVVRFIEEQVGKRAAAADAAVGDKMTGAVTATSKAVETGKVEQRPKIDTGVIAALGVAAAGLGGMIGGVASAFLGLGRWMPLGFLGLILLISTPSMVLAWLKLRKRNLGPLLDASGWAVNGRVKINLLLGAALTRVAKLPANANRMLDDPFEDKDSKLRRRLWVMIALLAGIVGILTYKGVPDLLGELWAKR